MGEWISRWIAGLSPGWLLVLLAAFFTVTIGTYVLQAYLSGRQGRWPGLVLPVLFFLDRLVIALRAWRGLRPFLWDLLWSNIGTYLLLLIYYVCRDRMRQACKKDELEQMNRQDLE